jgi:hypothetical protein
MRVLEAQTVSDISALRVIHADGLFVAVARLGIEGDDDGSSLRTRPLGSIHSLC